MKENRTKHDLFVHQDELSAYILGFWFADGGISLSRDGSRYRKVFRLYNTDRQIMERLGKEIGTLSFREVKPRLPHHKVCYIISVNSDTLFDYCYSLVGTTSKSTTPISLPRLNPELMKHFVRGYLDGDGSLYVKTYKNRHGRPTEQFGLSFTAGKDTGQFLEELSGLLVDEVGVSKRKIVGRESRKLVFAQHDAFSICKWVYDGSNIHMERKKAVWASVDADKVREGEKYRKKS